MIDLYASEGEGGSLGLVALSSRAARKLAQGDARSAVRDGAATAGGR